MSKTVHFLSRVKITVFILLILGIISFSLYLWLSFRFSRAEENVNNVNENLSSNIDDYVTLDLLRIRKEFSSFIPNFQFYQTSPNIELSIQDYSVYDSYAMQYPVFEKDKIYESEIISFQDASIIDSCFFCNFPEYKKVFVLQNRRSRYIRHVSAFTSSREGGDSYITILTDSPEEWTGYAKKYHVDVKILPGASLRKKGFGVHQLSCGEPGINNPYSFYMHSRVIEYRCHIPNELAGVLLNDCFEIMVYSRGKRVLTEPLLVRHCHNRRRSLAKTASATIPELEPEFDISICSIVSSHSNQYYLEWIEYHLMIGVDHFFLYLSPGVAGIRKRSKKKDKSGFDDVYAKSRHFKSTYYLLEKYIAEGVIELVPWNFTMARSNVFNKDQIAAMYDCIRRNSERSKFFALIDLDEFIVPTQYERENSLKMALAPYDWREVAELGMNSWQYSKLRKSTTEEINGIALTIEMYPHFVEPLANMRKIIVSSVNTVCFYTHYLCDGFTHESKRENMEVVNLSGQVHLAHYFYRKMHEYNPYISEADRSKFSKDPYFFNDEQPEGTVAMYVEDLKVRIADNVQIPTEFHFEFDGKGGKRNDIDKRKHLKPTCCTHTDLNSKCCDFGQIKKKSQKDWSGFEMKCMIEMNWCDHPHFKL